MSYNNNSGAPEKNKYPGGSAPQRSKAGFVWLLIMLILGSMILFKSCSPEQKHDLNQSIFEQRLKDKAIESIVLIPDGENVYNVEGKLKEKTSDERGNQYISRVILSADLEKSMRESGAKITVENDNSGFWNFILASVLPVLLIIGVIYLISVRQMRMNGHGAMDFGKSKARMIPPDELNIHFSDIAGADEAKEEIGEIVEYLRDPLRFQLVGGRIPKGCLLVGNPGTGKTLMAKAVACEAGVPFFSISGSDFVEMFVGVGASRVRDMFDQARKNTPCLIFIDEIDAVGRSRFSGWGGGHDEREQTLNAMLVEMDGLESRNGVIVLAATNRPDVLDPALLRPGRFDRQVVMDLPDITGRRQILDVHVKKIKVADSIDLDVIARTTPGFSGADLANLCNEAALLAARRNKDEITQDELEEARDKVSYGTERRSRRINDRERKLTAYHEAGHTLVALHNEYCVPVHKVTIIPRGQSALGATFMMPKEDTYTKSKLELKAMMAMSLGGRAAEEIVFGDVTTGASADIEHLTGIARKMVCQFGMSKLGPIKMGDFTNHPHMRIDGLPPDGISNETEREIDMEVRALIDEAYKNALNCLTEHRDQLDKIAEELLVKETISIAQINELLGLTPASENSSESVAAEPAVETGEQADA
ncbi:MAG: ATP-dependent metallopeptidase FtsH/Yme1/Tma family protein [Lentisphaerae bacterium]|nr:ATP-dependent metallopeptidase FtsH/Yme1/Tma family protein [Lentisphaerota bacterium]MBQ4329499.1 ATP-dependent zinc metalloprotease FtsH [Lentisphaeria bacterium]